MMARWSNKESLVFFLTAVLVYVFPLILADYFYVEDSDRAIDGYASWLSEGRILIDGFYHALSMSNGAPDMFPLGLLVACGVMAWALRALAVHYFSWVNLFSSSVVLPMFFSPLFLSDLAYKYDGPVITVGVALVMFAITLRCKRKALEWGGGTLLLWCALCMYQPLLNVYVGLCCIELYRAINDKKHTRDLAVLVGEKLTQAAAAVLFYRVAVVPFMDKERQDLLALDGNWASIIFQRLENAEERIRPLYTGGSAWLFAGMAVLFVLGYLWTGWLALRGRPKASDTVLMSLAYAVIIPLLIICVPGIMLVFLDENNTSRVMLGTGPLLVFMLLVIHQWLKVLHRHLTVLVVLPIIVMMSVSYSYGRVLSLKKTLEASLMTQLAYSISSTPELTSVGVFYFDDSVRDYWLPASEGTVSFLPSMPYLVNANFIFLPQALARIGITNVVPASDEQLAGLRRRGDARLVVDHSFYAIYVERGDGYIVMKKQPRDHPNRGG